MKAPSLVPPGPKGPAIPKAPSNLVAHPKMSKPRLHTIKRMMMRGGMGGGPKISPFGMGG
jgi:hypothetical protein